MDSTGVLRHTNQCIIIHIACIHLHLHWKAHAWCNNAERDCWETDLLIFWVPAVSQVFPDRKYGVEPTESDLLTWPDPPRCSSRACYDSWNQLRLSPVFGCICPTGSAACEQIFDLVHRNPCVGQYPRQPPALAVASQERLWDKHIDKKKA